MDLMLTPMPPLDLIVFKRRPAAWLRHGCDEIHVNLPKPIKIRRFSNDRTVSPGWCSAANPFSEQIKFAVGFDGGVREISGGEEDFSCLSNRIGQDDATFGVDWLDPNTIVSGGRRGDVCLWDTRTHGQSMRFRHPAQINHVRKLKGSQVAVTGMNESVSRHTRDPPHLSLCRGFFHNPLTPISPCPALSA